MATTERARITGFFIIGFLVGLITMWALVKGGTWKVSADIDMAAFEKCLEETTFIDWTDSDDDGRLDGQNEDTNGDGEVDIRDFPPEVQNNLRRCLAIAGGI